MIPKGCTCENEFSFPFDKDEVVALCVTYKQNKEVKLKKRLDDCTLKDGKIYVALEQEDTLKFDDKGIIRVQIKARLKNGKVPKSNIMETYTDEDFCNEVI